MPLSDASSKMFEELLAPGVLLLSQACCKII